MFIQLSNRLGFSLRIHVTNLSCNDGFDRKRSLVAIPHEMEYPVPEVALWSRRLERSSSSKGNSSSGARVTFLLTRAPDSMITDAVLKGRGRTSGSCPACPCRHGCPPLPMRTSLPFIKANETHDQKQQRCLDLNFVVEVRGCGCVAYWDLRNSAACS